MAWSKAGWRTACGRGTSVSTSSRRSSRRTAEHASDPGSDSAPDHRRGEVRVAWAGVFDPGPRQLPRLVGVDRWATFDCYGTLIDWNAGIRAALAGIWPNDDPDALLASYHEVEPGLEADGTRSYRYVLRHAVAEVATMRRLAVPNGAEAALADSVPSWRPFPEVPASLGRLREDGWRLAILSNTDADYLDASLRSIGVPL